MTKVVQSSEYSENSISVGCSVNEDGEPLVEINHKAVGTVAGLLEFIGKYRDPNTVNVRWVVDAPPSGFLALNLGSVVAGSLSAEDGSKPVRLSDLKIRIDEIEASFAKRVEKVIRSANRRNIRKT